MVRRIFGAPATNRTAPANARTSANGRFLRESRKAATKCTPSAGSVCCISRQKCVSMALDSTPTLAPGIQRAACAATTLLTAESTIRRVQPVSASLAPMSIEVAYSME